MRIRVVLIGVLGLALASATGCAASGTTEPLTVTVESIVTTTATTTATVTESPVVESEAQSRVKSAADLAACRQISRAADSSGLREVTDKLIAGGSPSSMSVLTASMDFAKALETAPTDASPDILTALLGMLTAEQEMEANFGDMFGETPTDETEKAITGMRVFTEMLDEACA